jgi:nickel-dependent lactate racemase
MLSNNNIKLLYGKNGLLLNIQNNWKPQIIRKPNMPIIKNVPKKVNEIFNNLINSEEMTKICKNSKSACILVCDVTRPVPNHLFLEYMIKEIEKSGIKLENILIIIATGLHRPAPKTEIEKIIGSNWILKNIKIVNHYARDDNNHRKIGVTSRGNLIKLDKRFLDSDIKIVTGLVEPHFMAGYSGGRKVIAPGIAHAETITTFHSARYMETPV